MKTGSQALYKSLDGSVQQTGVKKRKTTLSRRCSVPLTMVGRPASAGMAVGLVVVVANIDDMARVKEGMVVVAKTASPALAMVMSHACGLATEQGGLGAIASGFARAHGIPAVVGIEGLLKTVREGDLMQVNGTKGIVEIVKRNAVRLTMRGPSGSRGEGKEAGGRPEASCPPNAMQLRLEGRVPGVGDR